MKSRRTYGLDFVCLPNAHTDPNSVITIRNPDTTSFYRCTLRVSGDLASSAHGHADVGVSSNMSAEGALLDWVLVNSRLCAVRLDGCARVNSSQLSRCCVHRICIWVY